MTCYTTKLAIAGKINPPKWLPHNIHYEAIMGSVAYGASSDTSDMDLCGFAIPTKELIFPHLAGEITGFGTQINRFEQYQQHHIDDPESRKTFDITIYSIVKYFQLVMQNNPNMIDSLFVPLNCVTHVTEIGKLVRENRHMFLHKGAYHKFSGYSFSQMNKIKNKNSTKSTKRVKAILDEYGIDTIPTIDNINDAFHNDAFLPMLTDPDLLELKSLYDTMGNREFTILNNGIDTKKMYHVVRLQLECEQILEEGDLDLMRGREKLKSIRRGEWSLQDIEEFFAIKERRLEALYASSELQHSPDEARIKQLLLDCLEQHYGSLEGAVNRDVEVDSLIRDMQDVLDKYQR